MLNGCSLTPKESEVLALLSEGALNKEIASFLGISLETVKKHNANIFRKINVRNRAEAVGYVRYKKTESANSPLVE